jgi:hypothetical protein
MSNDKAFQEELDKQAAETPQKTFDTSTATQFEVADGKSRDESDVKKAAKLELEKLLGVETQNAYGTLDTGIFQDKLDKMNASDMQSLAMRVGITPDSNKSVLEKNLMRSFVDFVRKNTSGGSFQRHVGGPNASNQKELEALCKEGF